jgi:hypothetical protein
MAKKLRWFVFIDVVAERSNAVDLKSIPFGGAGSNPANVLFPLRCFFFRFVLVAQLADRPLHTREAQGSIPCENLFVLYWLSAIV